MAEIGPVKRSPTEFLKQVWARAGGAWQCTAAQVHVRPSSTWPAQCFDEAAAFRESLAHALRLALDSWRLTGQLGGTVSAQRRVFSRSSERV